MAKQLKQNSAHGARITKPPFLKIYASQLIVLAVVSVGLLFVDFTMAYSVLLGGLISIVPNTYFAILAFRYSGARAASNVAKSLYFGEVGKFILTATLFACVFVLVRPLVASALFAAFIAMMVLNWFLVLRLSNF